MLLKILLLSVLPYFHATYIGVVEILAEKHHKHFEVRVKLFTDDLEEAIRVDTGNGVLLRSQSQLVQHATLINNYIYSHLDINVDNQPVPLTFIRSVNDGETTFLFYRGNKHGNTSSVCVNTDLLMAAFPTQNNIVRLHIDNNERYLRLGGEKLHGEIVFNTP
uniref:DUF6702 family protein n=1 Tax=Fulvivirga sp. TaxID=1931237 RepID=UPI00404AF64E